jgi:8-oxo-dGTP pyrophosphatase MutT (NUDIX family)
MTWVENNSMENISPITQVYGICFNEKGEILVCREESDGKWQLPGGTPERDETIQQTLEREFLEEVDIEVKNFKVLGYQKVEYPNNPNKDEGDRFYQVRCICEVKELLPQTTDPATGNTWERMFVLSDKITEYVKWGGIGEAMFKAAIDIRNLSI